MTPQSETGLFEFTVAQALFELPDHLALEAGPTRVPVMNLLVRLGRPRTLVHLGLHRAGAYIAACSAARRHHTETACYGLWSGTEPPPLLSHLEGVVRPFHPASAILSDSDQRLHAAFPDGGVDLLWLDQLCGPDLWRVWAPKLSTRGVVALPGIHHAAGSDLRVQLWTELKAGRPHLEFGLDFGFGVVLLGSEQAAALPRLFETWGSTPPFRALLSGCYEQAEQLLPGRIEARWRAQARASEPS